MVWCGKLKETPRCDKLKKPLNPCQDFQFWTGKTRKEGKFSLQWTGGEWKTHRWYEPIRVKERAKEERLRSPIQSYQFWRPKNLKREKGAKMDKCKKKEEANEVKNIPRPLHENARFLQIKLKGTWCGRIIEEVDEAHKGRRKRDQILVWRKLQLPGMEHNSIHMLTGSQFCCVCWF